MTWRWPVAILGSGNIGTDLMLKIMASDGPLIVAAMVGVDPDGLACTRRMGVPVYDGVEGLLSMPDFASIRLAFDATSAGPHRANWAALRDSGIRMLDLTPASVGPFCVPAVNLDDHIDAPNLNMVSCGGQATVPIVAAVGKAGLVSYAEVVTSIPAKSADPATRADIDESIETTATALRVVGGARRGKAVLILNPAEPAVPMRNTVYCLVNGEPDHDRIEREIHDMVDRVAGYAPGYRLKQDVQFQVFDRGNPLYIPETGRFTGTRVTVMLEVAGEIMAPVAKFAAERIGVHDSKTAGATT